MVFWGTDELAAQEAALLWRRRFQERQAEASVFVVEADGPATEVRLALSEAAGTFSLFSAAKLIVINHFLNLKDETGEKMLWEVLETATPGEVVVFLWHRGTPDRRRSIVKKLVEGERKGRVTIHNFTAPERPAERTAWLRQFWERNGCTYEPRVPDLAEEATRAAPFGVLRQLAQVLVVAGAPRLDEQLVRQYLPEKSRPEDFAITDALQRRNREQALRQLATLSLVREERIQDAIMNFGSIVWFIENGWKLRELADQGLLPAQWGGAAKLAPFVVQKMTDVVRAVPEPQWREWYRRAAIAEWQVKHGDLDLASAAERLIWDITTPAR